MIAGNARPVAAGRAGLSRVRSAMSTNEIGSHEHIDRRDVRAITEVISVLNDVGKVRGTDDLYEVVSDSGKSYTVDLRQRVCECSDFEYNLPVECDDVTTRRSCKHVTRCAYEIGARPISPRGRTATRSTTNSVCTLVENHSSPWTPRGRPPKTGRLGELSPTAAGNIPEIANVSRGCTSTTCHASSVTGRISTARIRR